MHSTVYIQLLRYSLYIIFNILLLILRLPLNFLGSVIFILNLHLSRFSTSPTYTPNNPHIILNYIQLFLFWFSPSSFPFIVYFHNHSYSFCFLSPYHIPKPSQPIFSHLVHYKRYTNTVYTNQNYLHDV